MAHKNQGIPPPNEERLTLRPAGEPLEFSEMNAEVFTHMLAIKAAGSQAAASTRRQESAHR